jgi:hypothetical protein
MAINGINVKRKPTIQNANAPISSIMGWRHCRSLTPSRLIVESAYLVTNHAATNTEIKPHVRAPTTIRMRSGMRRVNMPIAGVPLLCLNLIGEPVSHELMARSESIMAILRNRCAIIVQRAQRAGELVGLTVLRLTSPRQELR